MNWECKSKEILAYYHTLPTGQQRAERRSKKSRKGESYTKGVKTVPVQFLLRRGH